jgi:uncharacterized protein (DUF58 family)
MLGFFRKTSVDEDSTPVRKRPSLDFSLTGLIYIAMMLFMGLAAINSQANLLFGVFGLMIGILLVSGIISRMVLRNLDITRRLPENGVVGQPMTVSYEFGNRKRFWPSLSVTLAELDGVEAFQKQPHGYMLHAAARMTATVPVELIPKRRGLYALGRHQVSTSFPFGFIKRAMERVSKDKILIFPAMAMVAPQFLSRMLSAESSGPMMRPRRGGMDEFYGLKEHRSGENPRWIYWKRSARTGTLVAKEMTHVSPPRILMLLDTFTEDDSRAGQAEVERCIAMAGSLAHHAIEQNLALGMVCWTRDGWLSIQPNRGKRHRADILTALAMLPANHLHRNTALLDEAVALQKSGTTSVLFTPQDVRLGLGESARGGMIVVSSRDPLAQAWFRFEQAVDFLHCAPFEEKVTN